MVMEIKREFAANLKDVKWMSEETKKKAKEKVSFLFLFCLFFHFSS